MAAFLRFDTHLTATSDSVTLLLRLTSWDYRFHQGSTVSTSSTAGRARTPIRRRSDGHGHHGQWRWTFSETNQAIYGPNSVDYILDNSAVSILRLKAGDRVQLVNNSVSGRAQRHHQRDHVAGEGSYMTAHVAHPYNKKLAGASSPRGTANLYTVQDILGEARRQQGAVIRRGRARSR